MNKETITLEYHVPQLGKVTARLYPFATESYRLLDHYGHIDRMREIDQLGVIRNVYEGAHHSRWEYVMVQLGLIHHLSTLKDVNTGNITRGMGLTSNNIEILDQKPSGAEILQIWTLLFNAGHLPGTFATERALLRCCKEDTDLRRTIYTGLPQQPLIRDYFKNILEEESIYSFPKILTYFHIERYHRYQSNIPKFVDFLHGIINFYIFESEEHEEKQNNLKNLFRRIRQMSYLFLDSQYTPVPLDFNLSTIFLNLPDYLTVLFKERDSSIIRTLDSFESFLSINMYHSADSVRAVGAHAKRIEQMIDKHKEEKELTKITRLHKYLMEDYGKFQPEHKDRGGALNIHVFFEIPPFPPLISAYKKHISHDIEENWNNKYGTRSCQLTFQPGPTSEHVAITLSFFPKSQIQTNVRIIGNFLKDMINLNNNIKFGIKEYSFIIDGMFLRPYQDLSRSIFGYITDETLSFEFKNDSPVWISMLPVKGSTNAANVIKYISKDVDSTNSRVHELKTLQNSLLDLKHRSELLLSLSQILVYDHERKHLTDIDGFGLGFKNGNLGVLLVEAKDQRRRSQSASKNQLKETLKKLNFKTSETPDIISIEGGAYCYLTIDGN
jgi:hypothetical protein